MSENNINKIENQAETAAEPVKENKEKNVKCIFKKPAVIAAAAMLLALVFGAGYCVGTHTKKVPQMPDGQNAQGQQTDNGQTQQDTQKQTNTQN